MNHRTILSAKASSKGDHLVQVSGEFLIALGSEFSSLCRQLKDRNRKPLLSAYNFTHLEPFPIPGSPTYFTCFRVSHQRITLLASPQATIRLYCCSFSPQLCRTQISTQFFDSTNFEPYYSVLRLSGSPLPNLYFPSPPRSIDPHILAKRRGNSVAWLFEVRVEYRSQQ